jgi:CelD/BcsL family acetyltransferase involved in cellulose biosynthesis
MDSAGREDLRLETLASLDALGDELDPLVEQTRNVFSTREWLSIWWRHFGRGRPLLLRAGRDADGRLRVVLPLYVWAARPLRVVRFLGHGPGDELGPICAPGDRPAAALALRRTLAEAETDLFLGDDVRRDAGWPDLLGSGAIDPEASPVARLHGRTWEELLAAKSANLRQQIGRRERNLGREHDLRYRLADREGLQDALGTLFALHSARWHGRGAFRPLEAFHREFAVAAFDRGWARLWLLELDGQPAAAWYGFRFAGVESYYQAGRDPAWSRGAVGFVLLAHTVREALSDGMDEYRFLRGGEAYKFRLADEDPGLETIVEADGLAARAFLALRNASRRTPFLRKLSWRLSAARMLGRAS